MCTAQLLAVSCWCLESVCCKLMSPLWVVMCCMCYVQAFCLPACLPACAVLCPIRLAKEDALSALPVCLKSWGPAAVKPHLQAVSVCVCVTTAAGVFMTARRHQGLGLTLAFVQTHHTVDLAWCMPVYQGLSLTASSATVVRLQSCSARHTRLIKIPTASAMYVYVTMQVWLMLKSELMAPAALDDSNQLEQLPAKRDMAMRAAAALQHSTAALGPGLLDQQVLCDVAVEDLLQYLGLVNPPWVQAAAAAGGGGSGGDADRQQQQESWHLPPRAQRRLACIATCVAAVSVQLCVDLLRCGLNFKAIGWDLGERPTRSLVSICWCSSTCSRDLNLGLCSERTCANPVVMLHLMHCY